MLLVFSDKKALVVAIFRLWLGIFRYIYQKYSHICNVNLFLSMFQMDYEPLDGSVVSIDTTLNDGFVADDLNVSRRPSL